jgi:hypothetical protein
MLDRLKSEALLKRLRKIDETCLVGFVLAVGCLLEVDETGGVLSFDAIGLSSSVRED